jgi:hypothetical protein
MYIQSPHRESFRWGFFLCAKFGRTPKYDYLKEKRQAMIICNDDLQRVIDDEHLIDKIILLLQQK